MEQLLSSMMQSGGGGGKSSMGGGPFDMRDLQSQLGLEGGDKQDLTKQADQLWRFLDNLAENDPQAYADFLKSQARAAEAEQSQQLVKGSTAQFIIEAQLAQQADKASMALVHVWAARDDKLAPMATTNNGAKEIDASTNSWTGARIPMFEGKAPQVPPAAPPSIGSSSKTSSSRPAPASYQYHIGVHPNLIPLLALDQPPQLRPLLVEAALQFVEARHPTRFDRSQPCSIRVLVSQLQAAARAAQFEKASATTGTPHDLIQAMADMEKPSGTGSGKVATGDSSMGQTGDDKHKGVTKQLIQEIQAKEDNKRGADGVSVLRAFDKDGRECVIVEAELLDVSSAQDVSVEFEDSAGPTQVQVLALKFQSWSRTVSLPCLVDESECTAKYDKRKRILKVTVLVING